MRKTSIDAMMREASKQSLHTAKLAKELDQCNAILAAWG